VVHKLCCPQPARLEIFPLTKTTQNGVLWCEGVVPNNNGAYTIGEYGIDKFVTDECNDGSNGGGLHSVLDVHDAIDRDAHVAGIEGGRKLYWSDDADSNREDADETEKSGGGVSQTV